MRILYLGYAVSEEELRYKCGASIAGNKMENNLLASFVDNGLKPFILSVVPICKFPKGALVIKNGEMNMRRGLIAKKVPFVNLPILKEINIVFVNTFLSYKYIKKNKIPYVFTYNMNIHTSITSYFLKKLLNIEIICLLADPPIENKETFIEKKVNSLNKKILNKVDKVICLNEYAAKNFCPDIPYLCIDGAIDCKEIEDFKFKYLKRNIVFTGALTEYNGIKNLIEAFKRIDSDNLSLDIYGTGPLQDYIESEVCLDSRIKFNGAVDNITALKIQREAFLLVNPRKTEDYISKITFPSKIFEYLISGTPVLSTKLNGYTEEYNDLMFYSKTDSIEDLFNAIQYIINLSDEQLKEKAHNAYNFIKQHRTWDIQGEKIKQFIIK